MMKKISLGIIIFVVTVFIFSLLEFESSPDKINTLIQPLIFSLTLTISIVLPRFRKHILLLSIVLLIVMVLTYLFNMISISNWIGGLGFGMLVVTFFSYLPQLIKRGYIDKY